MNITRITALLSVIFLSATQLIAGEPAPGDWPRMTECIQDGLASFIDLQGRFYEAILCDVA